MDSESKININQETMRNILVVNLGGIGDFLLSTPALKAFKKGFSLAKISLLIVPRVYELAKDLPYIDNIFILRKSYRPLCLVKNLFTLWRLKRMRFDLALNIRTLYSKIGAGKIKLLLNIINPRIKMGRDTDGRGYFFDLKVPETGIGKKYEMEYNIDMIKTLGFNVEDRSIDCNISKVHCEMIDRMLKKEDIYENDVIVGIHPGGIPSRRWPIESFTQVIKLILQQFDCRFIFTGDKTELRLAKKLENILQRKPVVFSGRLKIKELCALINRCNIFISNDTGPMHIAAILKTPLVAIFGPGDIVRYDPRNIFNSAIVLYKKVECAPCEKVQCKDLKCLSIISSEEVAEAALKLLKRK